MGYENKAGLNVNNQYGARTTGGAVGLEHGEGSLHVLRIDLTGQSIADAIAGFIPPVVIPKYAKFKRAALQIDEVFTVTGTAPTLLVGATGAVATNGFVITQAELQALGHKELSTAAAGTWSLTSTTGTAGATKIGMGLGGTTPAIATTSGRGTLVLEFASLAKA